MYIHHKPRFVWPDWSYKPKGKRKKAKSLTYIQYLILRGRSINNGISAKEKS